MNQFVRNKEQNHLVGIFDEELKQIAEEEEEEEKEEEEEEKNKKGLHSDLLCQKRT